MGNGQKDTGDRQQHEGRGLWTTDPQLWFHAALLQPRLEQLELAPFWECQIPAVMLMSCKHLAARLRELHKLHLVATLGKTMPRQMSSIQGKQTYLVQQSCH